MKEDTKLFGDKTKQDWLNKRALILNDSNEISVWEEATELLDKRIETRYFQPITGILNIKNSKKQDSIDKTPTIMSLIGEGFAAMTLICSLIEFLQSCYEGKGYEFNASESDFVYGKSREKFKSFLVQHDPFKAVFTQSVSKPEKKIKTFADDFYSSVRCGLLHEAATNNSWIIKAQNANKNSKDFVDVSDEEKKIIFRNNFFEVIKDYFTKYKKNIIEDKKESFNNGKSIKTLVLRDGFCRKLDLLCDIPISERTGKWWQK